MTQEEITKLAKWAGRKGLSSPDLDELVHDAKSSEAADINNGGLEEQIAYIYKEASFSSAKQDLEGML